MRQKGLPGPPPFPRRKEGEGSDCWVPEPRAVAHASEAKVCIMRVQGKRLRAALQHHRLLSPAPRQHGAGDEAAGSGDGAAGSGDGAAGGDHEAAGSGDGAAGGGAEASDRGFLRTAVTGFGAACFGAASHIISSSHRLRGCLARAWTSTRSLLLCRTSWLATRQWRWRGSCLEGDRVSGRHARHRFRGGPVP